MSTSAAQRCSTEASYFPSDSAHLNKKCHAFHDERATDAYILSLSRLMSKVKCSSWRTPDAIRTLIAAAVMGYRARKHVSVVGAIIREVRRTRYTSCAPIIMRMMFSISAAAGRASAEAQQYRPLNCPSDSQPADSIRRHPDVFARQLRACLRNRHTRPALPRPCAHAVE